MEDAQKAREAYHQQVLRKGRYNLRKDLSKLGVSVKEIREAEAKGETEMVKLLMKKYDEGEVKVPGASKAKSTTTQSAKKSTAKKGTTKRKAKKGEPVETIEEEVDFDNDTDLDDIDFDDDGEDTTAAAEETEEEVVEEEVVEEEPPPVVQEEQSSLMDKVDQLMDMQVSMAETISDLNDRLNRLASATVEVKKNTLFIRVVATNAFARIFKLGASSPIKAFDKIKEKAYKASGITPPEKKKS